MLTKKQHLWWLAALRLGDKLSFVHSLFALIVGGIFLLQSIRFDQMYLVIPHDFVSPPTFAQSLFLLLSALYFVYDFIVLLKSSKITMVELALLFHHIICFCALLGPVLSQEDTIIVIFGFWLGELSNPARLFAQFIGRVVQLQSDIHAPNTITAEPVTRSSSPETTYFLGQSTDSSASLVSSSSSSSASTSSLPQVRTTVKRFEEWQIEFVRILPDEMTMRSFFDILIMAQLVLFVFLRFHCFRFAVAVVFPHAKSWWPIWTSASLLLLSGVSALWVLLKPAALIRTFPVDKTQVMV
eukprot:TRINITY_DN279_c0_g8_i1.p1 TRINITY_DN279_c0_g8~~TRINITY_DN279_c0_g8_i1.p1  ORF type:complete len:298 (-),score=25.51 TRINITY_DN279_c0_g8_i1:1568-2461(-)